MFLKFFLAILPILWLIIALSVLKIAGHKACLIALAITAVLAAGYWKLSLICTATAGLEGILNALWPICLVIVAALFTYNLTLETGAMELIKKMLASVSVDQRVLLLIIGWGFGNFMEGMAGFGTAVAIPASMLAAIGINPILSVIACLVVNSTPTAFGSVGVPTVTLASVTNLDVLQLSGNVALIQVILTFLSPFFMVFIVGKGFKAIKSVLPMILIGVAWASILAMPYAILAGSIAPKKMGVYMGIFNFFVVIPQIVNALIGGPIVKYLYNGDAIYALITSGVSFLIAALLVYKVKDVDDTILKS